MKTPYKKHKIDACPCGTGKLFMDCCGVFIFDEKNPATPEQLMRSRYTAYTLADVGYIERTMKSPALDDFDLDAAREWAQQNKWLGLKVIRAEQVLANGIVEFIATWSVNNKKESMHEVSQFILENGKWFYVDGDMVK